MSKLAGPTIIEAQDLYTQSVAPMHKLGQLGLDEYGNKYRYVKAGASALVTGNLLQEPAEDTQFRSMVVSSASAIGSKTISATLGSTAVTAGMFVGGELLVESGTGIGQLFRIVSHTVAAGAAVCTFTVDRPVKIALVASDSNISVRKNSYNGVIQYPATTQTGGAVGIALYAMTAAYYGWVQSGGDAVALFDTGTNTSNGVTALQPSQAVAGSVEVTEDAAGAQVIGFAREVVSVDSTMGFVKLMID